MFCSDGDEILDDSGTKIRDSSEHCDPLCSSLLFLNLVLTSKIHYIPPMKEACDLAARVNIADEAVAFMSEVNVHKEVQEAWNQLRQYPRNASNLRAQWLENIARYKASVKGDADAAKIL